MFERDEKGILVWRVWQGGSKVKDRSESYCMLYASSLIDR